MASITSERQPLLPTADPRAAKAARTVAFSDAPPGVMPSPSPSSSSTPRPLSFGTSPTRPTPLTHPTYPTPQQPQPQQNGGGQPMLATLNSKLRRRNSAGAPLMPAKGLPAASKIGPQRTTKNAQKLKLLPDPAEDDDGADEESGREVYSQFTRIKDPPARRDAARLGKADRERLPRVTAYCTASSYKLDGLMRFLKARAKTRGAAPKQFDECIYSPYDYTRSKSPRHSTDQPPQLQQHESQKQHAGDTTETAGGAGGDFEPASRPKPRRRSDSAVEVEEHTQARRGELIDLSPATEEALSGASGGESDGAAGGAAGTELAAGDNNPDFDIQVHTPEVFLFDYGTVVMWGMTLAQEKRFLKDIAKFETEKLAPDDVEAEEFNFYYTREYQARIYNDFISLREKRNYMTKLAISHALSQSVKTSLFEDLLSTTISDTTPLPGLLAETGRIALSRRAINKKIGELFILRINIHLQGSVLDSPELMWAEPRLEPVYAAVRSYLEMDQRVELMTERLSVLGDLLAVLKDQAGTRHGEYLEWIVIILIAAEILVAAVNIVVDLYAGVD